MIGYLQGKVLSSNGQEALLLTASGVGYLVSTAAIFPNNHEASLYISHIIREDSQSLYGFETLQDKKMFDLLTTVKGIGPKSAHSLLLSLGANKIIQAISLDDKKTLSSAPGIGAKASAQIILDLSKKIEQLAVGAGSIYSKKTDNTKALPQGNTPPEVHGALLTEALQACHELGFKEEQVRPMAIKILSETQVRSSEHLLELLLREV